MKSNTLIKLGAGAVLLVGGVLLAHKYTNNGGKHLKGNINKLDEEDTAASVSYEADPFRPESFASIKQADAYESLLKLFNNDSMALFRYLVEKHEGSKDYEAILESYMKELSEILEEAVSRN